jgi:Fe-Mn family superoxide dismutase
MEPRHAPTVALEGVVDVWVEAAKSVVGSGWVWMVAAGKRVRVVATGPAALPELLPGEHIMLVMDVWEHSYYLDYLNDRPTYARRWLLELARWP